MLRIHYLQQWFDLPDPAAKEALHDAPLDREFTKHDGAIARRDYPPADSVSPPAGSSRPGRRLSARSEQPAAEQNKGSLQTSGTVVDATPVAAPISTKNTDGQRDPEMRQTTKGNNWYVGKKAHIGVDPHPRLAHTVASATGSINDLNMTAALLRGNEAASFGDACYQARCAQTT